MSSLSSFESFFLHLSLFCGKWWSSQGKVIHFSTQTEKPQKLLFRLFSPPQFVLQKPQSRPRIKEVFLLSLALKNSRHLQKPLSRFPKQGRGNLIKIADGVSGRRVHMRHTHSAVRIPLPIIIFELVFAKKRRGENVKKYPSMLTSSIPRVLVSSASEGGIRQQ